MLLYISIILLEKTKAHAYICVRHYVKDQVPCWLTYTNGTSHEIIQNNLHRAPMFTGVVKGVGPR
ncbi:FAD-dependent oxidoreductase, partial [Streptococcus mitis]|uniref:FAD-dependent oxidoreductase n=1 Tax=Streptococcus mitis TaxID=28037 RepID=UPI0039C25321